MFNQMKSFMDNEQEPKKDETKINKVFKKTKSKIKNVSDKVIKISKKDIKAKIVIPRWLLLIITPFVISFTFIFITMPDIQFDTLDNIIKIPTLGLLSFKDREGTIFKIIGIAEETGEQIKTINRLWFTNIRFNIGWQDPTISQNGIQYIAIYAILGLIFWGFFLAVIGSFSGSKTTTKLVNDYTAQEIKKIFLSGKTNITDEDRKEIKVIVETKIENTEFYQKESLKDYKYKIYDVFLIIPGIYKYIKKFLFRNSFIVNEFNINWENNIASWVNNEIQIEKENMEVEQDDNTR